MEKKLKRVIFIFSIICLFLIGLIFVEAEILSGVRSYVRGEGLYAKGQKDAVISLIRFTTTKDTADFEDFQKNLLIPIGDRIARESLIQDPPNLENATKGFIQGRNMKHEISSMIDLFLYFNKVPFMSEAIDIWSRGDILIEELYEEGHRLKKEIALGDEEKIREQLNRVYELNRKLAKLEVDFSITISNGANLVSNVLVFTSFSISLVLFIILYL